MSLQDFVDRIYADVAQIQFDEAIEAIDANFEFTPVAFKCGDQHNEAGTNIGSCKILSFSHAMNLPESVAVHLFGDYFRRDVAENRDGSDHPNIREFMRLGWRGVQFEKPALKPRQ